ncbi:MAG: hypothetical protein ACR2QC_00145 [Gammaproteobacteria bacterium]
MAGGAEKSARRGEIRGFGAVFAHFYPKNAKKVRKTRVSGYNFFPVAVRGGMFFNNFNTASMRGRRLGQKSASVKFCECGGFRASVSVQ